MSEPSKVQGEVVEALVQKARRGDMDAFAVVFEGLRPDVFRLARRMVGEEDARDVVMDSFLKAWQAIPRFDGRSALKTWLYRIVYNCAVDSLRLRTRRREDALPDHLADAESGGHDIADAGQSSPDEAAAGRELASQMDEALARLTPEHRATLVLRYSEGLSYSQIASATGVSIGTVMSRLFNGKRHLRREFKGLNE